MKKLIDKFDELTLGPSTPPNGKEQSIDSQLENGEADEETYINHRALMNAARNTSGQEAGLQKLRSHFQKAFKAHLPSHALHPFLYFKCMTVSLIFKFSLILAAQYHGILELSVYITQCWEVICSKIFIQTDFREYVSLDVKSISIDQIFMSINSSNAQSILWSYYYDTLIVGSNKTALSCVFFLPI